MWLKVERSRLKEWPYKKRLADLKLFGVVSDYVGVSRNLRFQKSRPKIKVGKEIEHKLSLTALSASNSTVTFFPASDFLLLPL